MLEEKCLKYWSRKNFLVDQLYLVASPRSVGQKISFNSKEYEVCNLENI